MQVFYCIEDENAPEAIITYLETNFPDVMFTNLYKMHAFPKGLSMFGMQIKSFSVLFSTFEEVLYLDTDIYPITDPSVIFDAKPYLATGALFWPDMCSFKSTRREMWDIFQLPQPSSWPTLKSNEKLTWTSTCDPATPFEIQGGDMVINKRKVWQALVLAVFINKNYEYFYNHMIYGDKFSYSFADVYIYSIFNGK